MNRVWGWNAGEEAAPKHKPAKYNKNKKKEEEHLLNAGKAMARGKPRTAEWELKEAEKARAGG